MAWDRGRIRSSGGEFGVRLNLDGLRDFEQFEDQFPFAISHAMNATAKQDAVPHMREGLAASRPGGAGFTVRSKYTAGGIQFVKAATKTSQQVTVGAVSDYLLAQSEGAADNARPESKKPIGAVPIGATRVPKTKSLARRNDWPMQLIKRGLAYRPGVDHARKRRAVEGPLPPGQRRKVAKDEPDPLQPGQILYGTAKSAFAGERLWYVEEDRKIDLQPVYPALRLVKEAFDGGFNDQLGKSIKFAIRTSRKAGRFRRAGL